MFVTRRLAIDFRPMAFEQEDCQSIAFCLGSIPAAINQIVNRILQRLCPGRSKSIVSVATLISGLTRDPCGSASTSDDRALIECHEEAFLPVSFCRCQ